MLGVDGSLADGRPPRRVLELQADEIVLLLDEEEFADARVCPGSVEASFGRLTVGVSRVELRWSARPNRLRPDT